MLGKTPALIALTVLLAAFVQADFVMIKGTDVGADPATGYGDVGYVYSISRYEVTGAEFNTAVAADSRIGDCTSNTANSPAEYVSWYEAAMYCNWLTSGDAYSGAYLFDSGGNFLGIDRASAISTYDIIYALPTEDEWYKAAYWTGNESDPWSLYANGTDSTPTWGTTEGWNYRDGTYGYATVDQRPWEVGYGAQEQNGTYDMMGNVWEWTESDFSDSKKVPRGGGCANNVSDLSSVIRGGGYPDREYSSMGFRIVMVPEPSSVLLFFVGGIGALVLRREQIKKGGGEGGMRKNGLL